MSFTQYSDAAGKLVLRLTVGGLMLFHGIFKIFNGVDGIMNLFASKGIPVFLAYFAYLGEVVAPILLIIGFYTRISALLLGGTIVIAVLTAHTADISTLTRSGAWGIELQAFYILGALAIFFLGGGRYSVDGGR